MKTIKIAGIKTLSLAFTILVAIASSGQQTKTSQQAIYTLSGNADASQVIPAGTGNGAGTITGTYDPSTHVLDYTSNWNNLSGPPASAGFYMGAPGVAGKLIGDPWTLGSSASPSGSTSGKITLTDDQASSLLAGNWYYVYSTSSSPDGEIRGQVTSKKQ